METIRSAGPGLGYVLGGLIAAVASPRLAYLVAGLGGLVAVGVIAQAARGTIRSRPESPVRSMAISAG